MSASSTGPREPSGAATEPADAKLIAAVAAATGVLPARIRLERTHASRVVIAGSLAYKFKRRIDLGFLNFVSLEARYRACREELRLNRRLAPDVYIGLAALMRGADGSLRLEAVQQPNHASGDESSLSMDTEPQRGGRPGSVDDWAVVMRTLPEDRMLDGLLERGAVDGGVAADLDRLIDALVAFHTAAPRGPDVAAERTPERVRAMLERVLLGLAEQSSLPLRVGADERPPLSPALLAFVSHRARELLEATLPVLEARRAEGRVVEGHGDLHGRNICMIPGSPVAYDCIEFSRALRCRDVSGEIAFLAMDLDAHGRADLAERVVRRYSIAASDPTFAGPQRYLRLSDALVRTLVEWMKATGETAPTQTSSMTKTAADSPTALPASDRFISARRFAQLGVGYALEPSAIIMCGLPGSGKSTLARAMRVPLRAVVLRSDVIRKQLAGVPPTTRGDASLYDAEMTMRVYRTLLEEAIAALQDGRHVILDAAFPTRTLRAMAIEAVTKAGCALSGAGIDGGAWLLVECAVAEQTLRKRLAERVHDASEVSDADERVLHAMSKHFERPDEIDPVRRVRFEARENDGDDSRSAVMAILERLVRLESVRSAKMPPPPRHTT